MVRVNKLCSSILKPMLRNKEMKIHALAIFISFISINAFAETMEFDAATGILICPNGQNDCFRKLDAFSLKLDLIPIYDDIDIEISSSQSSTVTSVQGFDINSSVQVVKTRYKQSGDTYYDIELRTWEKSTDAFIKNGYSFKKLSDFNGVLSAAGSKINVSGVERRPIVLVAPKGYRLLR